MYVTIKCKKKKATVQLFRKELKADFFFLCCNFVYSKDNLMEL